MLSLERTEEGITVCDRLARLIPSRSWFFSFLYQWLKSKSYSLKILFFLKKSVINTMGHITI
jgi:hypothetical protein